MKSINIVLIIFISFFSLVSCRVTKHLKEGQYISYKQSVKGNREISNSELSGLYRQETNRSFLGFLPGVSIYYWGKSFYSEKHVQAQIASTREKFDKKLADPELSDSRENRLRLRKERQLNALQTKLEKGNWIMRGPGEAPAIYDSALVSETARQMTYYVHSKGFLRGNVDYKADTVGRRVFIDYNVHENVPFRLMHVKYHIKTPSIDSLVKAHINESKLKTGDRYDEAKITEERERLNRLMKNNGFYDFTRQFIFFEVDTTIKSKQVAIDIIIQNPSADKLHQQYRISKLFYDTDINISSDRKDTVKYETIHFIYSYDKFSRRILNHKLQLHPGDLFNQEKIQATQRQLALLDTYRFININFEKDENDTTEARTLTAFINTSPLKRFQITDEIGINVVTQAFVPGPFGSLTFRQRNVFGGFEILEVNVRGSIDGQASVTDPTNILRTLEYGGSVSLTFPEIFIPTRLRYKFYPYSPRTRFLLGYNLLDRPEYKRGNVKGTMSYNWFPTIHSNYTVTIADLNVINSVTKDAEFDRYLEDLASRGNPLIRSFTNSFVSSVHASYVVNNQQFGVNRKSRYIRLFAESGGTTMNLLNRFESNEDDKDRIAGLSAFRFLKANTDFRFYYPTGPKSSFAMRYNIGVARPYSKDNILPYEKYFFGGGSNSIRAWAPRRLGPGRFAMRDTITNEITYQFEQQADIILETSFEYRFNMIGFLDGAVFIDAGNTWMMTEEASRPGSGFDPTAIAVGSGFGLRLNFSFLILRFDLGLKMYDPAETKGERFVAKHLISQAPFGRRNQAVINIGIGYPF